MNRRNNKCKVNFGIIEPNKDNPNITATIDKLNA